ncbi:hypothetical protein [Variovorax paradoxus]|uniref:hypothetical protein n=1 Tax=Variovorax paradoxus TaxID=34073 RepID=UPI001ABCC2A2
MRKLQPFLSWVVSNRHLTAFVLLVIAAGALKYRADTPLPLPTGLQHQAVTITYLGPLTLSRSRSGRNAGTTHFDGGYGVGIPNELEKNSLLQRLQPEIYFQFAEALHVNEDDIARMHEAGNSFTLSTWQGQIVAVAGPRGPLIPYERYAEQIERSKRIALIVAICIAATAVATWIASSMAVRRARHAASS